MKKWKKFLGIVMSSAMVAAMLAGCGNQDNSSANGTVSNQSNESSSASNTDASGSGSFKIGGIGPTTGGAAIYGVAVQNAAQLAIEEINAAGGANGYTFELNFQDDEHDAEKSVNAYNTLKDWGAQMLVGCVTSTPCIAVVEKSKDDNMFQITPSGSAVECVKYENAFRVCFADPDQGVRAAEYISANNLATKVAVIYDSSDVYSTGIYESFAAEAKNKNIEIVSAEAFTADSKTDFSVQLQKAKDGNADLVFLPIYYSESSLILSQAASMNYSPIFFSCDGMDGILGVKNFDTSLANGVMFLSPFAADANEKAAAFSEAYTSKFGETPNQFAADAYDAVYILKAAIEAGNVTPDMSVSDICEALKSAIVGLNFDGTTGTGISWTADGEPHKDPIVIEIQNGAYTIR